MSVPLSIPAAPSRPARPRAASHEFGAVPASGRTLPAPRLSPGGEPLDAGVRSECESRFRCDFSGVRIHRDAAAAAAARAVEARAFTVGSHIVFGDGAYAPQSRAGRALVAHELTHVLQQNRSTAPAVVAGIDSAHGAAEGEAESAARTFVATRGPIPRPVRTAAGCIQRQPLGSGGLGSADDGALLWESYRNSLTLAGFDSDKSELKPDHDKSLADWKARFQVLLGRYPDSAVSVIGHTDATDTEQHNQALGQDRANAVRDALTTGDNAVSAGIVSAGSVGESVPAVETKGREARNRRVEIIPRLRQGRQFNFLTPPSPPVTSVPGDGTRPDQGRRNDGIGGPGPSPSVTTPKIPELRLPPRNWFKEGLERDPIIKGLPDWMREKVIDGLKDGDEMIAEKVIDALPLDDKVKAAIQAIAKGLLKTAKNQKFTPPESPSRVPDFGPSQPFAPSPGQTLFPGPKWTW